MVTFGAKLWSYPSGLRRALVNNQGGRGETVYRWSGLTLASVSDTTGTFTGDPDTSTEPHVKAAVAARLNC